MSEGGGGAEALSFPCPYCPPDGPRSFTTKIGLGVHKRKVHPIETNEENLTQLESRSSQSTHRRWTHDEVRKLALAEAQYEIDFGGPPTNEQLFLLGVVRRTLSAITERRKKYADYHRIVQGELRRLRGSIGPEGLQEPQPEVEQSCLAGAGTLDMVHGSDISMSELSQLVSHVLLPTSPGGRHGTVAGGPLAEQVSAPGPSVPNFDSQNSPWIRSSAPASPIPTQPLQCHLPQRDGDQAPELEDWRNDIWTYLRELQEAHPPSGLGPDDRGSSPINDDLELRFFTGSNIRQELERLCMKHFGVQVQTQGPRKQPVRVARARPRRQERRREYRDVQSRWAKNRNDAADFVLDGKWCAKAGATGPDLDKQVAFWRGIFGADSVGDERPVVDLTPPVLSLMKPVTTEEVLGALTATKRESAPGPDGVRLLEVQEIGVGVLAKIYNLMLLAETQPVPFRQCRTALIPKGPCSDQPGDYRPITMAPMIVRVFHKILSKRLQTLPIHQSQKAFRKVDGCLENVLLLDVMLRQARLDRRPISVAFIDLAKAFDSVSHHSVLRAARRIGVPEPLVNYFKSGFQDAFTSVLGVKVPMTTGVKQGDPVSPLLFNAVLDEAIQGLDPETGFVVGGKRVNCLAFADDVALVAETHVGLQRLIDEFYHSLLPTGLRPNPTKCATLSGIVDGKAKKWLIDTRTRLTVANTKIPVMGIVDTYKYLGILLSGAGVENVPNSALTNMLDHLRRAPLKPGQRMYILRVNLIPRLLHGLVVGRTSACQLKLWDRMIRRTVRKWLRLPESTPISYFYAPVSQGGLGIACLSQAIPLYKHKRLAKLATSEDPRVRAAADTQAFRSLLEKWSGSVHLMGQTVSSKREAQAMWRDLLHSSVDGSGIREAGGVPYVHSFVCDGSAIMKPADYIFAIQSRINGLPTKARLSRGQNAPDRLCDKGCSQVETLGHIQQVCYASWGARVQRHNRVLQLTAEALRKKGCSVEVEPAIRTPDTLMRPDLVVGKADKAYILDVQIVSDANAKYQCSLTHSHNLKVSKYNIETVREWAKEKTQAREVHVSSVTLNWRGCIAVETAQVLRELGLSQALLRLLAIRTLEGSRRIYNMWRMTTGYRAPVLR